MSAGLSKAGLNPPAARAAPWWPWEKGMLGSSLTCHMSHVTCVLSTDTCVGQVACACVSSRSGST